MMNDSDYDQSVGVNDYDQGVTGLAPCLHVGMVDVRQVVRAPKTNRPRQTAIHRHQLYRG